MMEAGRTSETLVKHVTLQKNPADSRLVTRFLKNQKPDRFSFIFYIIIRLALNSSFSQVIWIS
jgi:hypothetical protein